MQQCESADVVIVVGGGGQQRQRLVPQRIQSRAALRASARVVAVINGSFALLDDAVIYFVHLESTRRQCHDDYGHPHYVQVQHFEHKKNPERCNVARLSHVFHRRRSSASGADAFRRRCCAHSRRVSIDRFASLQCVVLTSFSFSAVAELIGNDIGRARRQLLIQMFSALFGRTGVQGLTAAAAVAPPTYDRIAISPHTLLLSLSLSLSRCSYLASGHPLSRLIILRSSSNGAKRRRRTDTMVRLSLFQFCFVVSTTFAQLRFRSQ